MDDAATLAALEAIKRLKARYFYHLDMKDWAAWRDVFAEDAVVDVSSHFPDAPDPSVHMMRGADTIVRTVSGQLEGTVTVHHGHMPLLDIDGPEDARGIWAMEDNLFMADGSRLLGYGHYHERYRLSGGAWRIQQTRLSRLKLVHTPPPAKG